MELNEEKKMKDSGIIYHMNIKDYQQKIFFVVHEKGAKAGQAGGRPATGDIQKKFVKIRYFNSYIYMLF